MMMMLEQPQASSSSASSAALTAHTALAKMNTKAVQYLCEGRFEEAMTLFCTCLSKAKGMLQQTKKHLLQQQAQHQEAHENDQAISITTTTTSSSSSLIVTTTTPTQQLRLTEIPVEGAIGADDVYNAAERDTCFALYQCALVTSPLRVVTNHSSSQGQEQDQQQDEDEEKEENELFLAWCQRMDQPHPTSREATRNNSKVSKEDDDTPKDDSSPHDQESQEGNDGQGDTNTTQEDQDYQEDEDDDDDEEVYPEPWHYATLLTFCSVVTFNLGLVFHELGLSEGRLPHLAKARSLYNTGLELLKQLSKGQQQQSRNNGNAQVAPDAHSLPQAWLQCALHNNAGHVAAFFADPTGMRQARRGLRAALQPRHHHHRHGQLPRHFYQSLVLARTHHKTTTLTATACHPAAAA